MTLEVMSWIKPFSVNLENHTKEPKNHLASNHQQCKSNLYAPHL